MAVKKKAVNSAAIGTKKTVKKLTLKQAKFTKEYLKSGNATDAARKTYKVDDNTARSMGSENLAKPAIQQAVASAAEKLGINPEYVLRNFKNIVDFNIKPTIKAKRIGEETFHEEEMVDAQAAIRANEMLGKHLKLFVEKVEMDANIKEDITEVDLKKKIATKIMLSLKNPDLLNLQD